MPDDPAPYESVSASYIVRHPSEAPAAIAARLGRHARVAPDTPTRGGATDAPLKRAGVVSARAVEAMLPWFDFEPCEAEGCVCELDKMGLI